MDEWEIMKTYPKGDQVSGFRKMHVLGTNCEQIIDILRR
jgi:hypothetical protein